METASFDMTKVTVLTPDVLDFWWTDIESLLDETPEQWRHLTTKADIHKSLHDGGLIAWSHVVENENSLAFLALTVQFSRPMVECLRVVYMGGPRLREFLPLLVGTLEHHAHRAGCHEVDFQDRTGLAEELVALGYRPLEVVFCKNVQKQLYH